MLSEAFRQLGFWNLALCYYARQDPSALLDPDGDQLVDDFIVPLVEQLRAAGVLGDYSWMRYAEGGFHLRCQFRAASQEQARRQLSCIAEQFERVKQARPVLFSGRQRLSPIARTLNQNAGIRQLHPPGTLRSGPVHDSGEQHVYDHATSYLHVMRGHTHWSDVALQALAATSSYQQRLGVAVPVVLALLVQYGSNPAERAAHALFIATTWRLHFGIDATQEDPAAATLWRQRASIQALLDVVHLDPRHAIAQLAPALQPTASRALAWGSNGAAALATERPALRAMQVLSLVHQVANRLGISLIDEAALCELVHQHLWAAAALPLTSMQADVATWTDYWSRPHVDTA